MVCKGALGDLMSIVSISKRRDLYRHLPNGESDGFIIEAERVGSVLLPYIHRGIPNYTGHGIEHSQSVARCVNRYIDALIVNKYPLNETEIRLLYMASWLHDIGNIRVGGRVDHARTSCDMLKKLAETDRIRLGNLLHLLIPIVLYHSSSQNISLLDDRGHGYEGDPMRMKLLCALFRLADASDMGEKRAYRLVYSLVEDELDEESKQHWRSNNAVISVEPDPASRCVRIVVTDAEMAKTMTEHFKAEFEAVRPILINYLQMDEVVVEEIPSYLRD